MTKMMAMLSTAAIALLSTMGWAQAENKNAATQHQTVFACNRLALSPAARHRHFDELGPALRDLRKKVRELPNGYEFEFPSDANTVATLTEWAGGERLCCPFFDIEVRMEAENGPVWLRLTGRKGTKQFIEADAAAWVKR